MILPTVAVRHPLAPDVRMVINASDFVEGEHVLWPEVPAAAAVEPTIQSKPAAAVVAPVMGLRVQRGARGLWFVKRDGETVGPGYKTEAEAEAAKATMMA